MIWRFPKIGVTPNHPFQSDFPLYIDHSFLGTLIYGTPVWFQLERNKSVVYEAIFSWPWTPSPSALSQTTYLQYLGPFRRQPRFPADFQLNLCHGACLCYGAIWVSSLYVNTIEYTNVYLSTGMFEYCVWDAVTWDKQSWDTYACVSPSVTPNIHWHILCKSKLTNNPSQFNLHPSRP